MSTIVFKKSDYTVQNLLAYVEQGDLGLPELQRPFIWADTKVRDLFDSMYRGYPIGAFLFWENEVPDAGRPINPFTNQKVPKLLVIDGQQRITSLFTVIRGIPVVRKDGRKERIKIAFNPFKEKFEVSNAVIEKDPEWLADISVLWSPDKKKAREAFWARLRQHRFVSEEEEKRVEAAFDRLESLVHFPVVALEIASHADEQAVADIFVRINSSGTPLNQANFILTLMSVYWDEGRAELERFCFETRTPPSQGVASPFNHVFQPEPDKLLRVPIALGFRRARLEHVYALLRGKDLETGAFSDERRLQQFERLKKAQKDALDLINWHEFLHIIREAGFRRKELISSQYALLYTYALYLIGKLDFRVDHLTLRQLLARWLFMTVLTERYSHSPESSFDQDLADLRNLRTAQELVALLENKIKTALTEDYWSSVLPNNLAVSTPRHPAFLAYQAALVLLDAQAFFSSQKIADLFDPSLSPQKKYLDRHHLFPRSYLRKLGITDRREVNQVANLVLIEWSDNVTIGEKPPHEYMPELKKRLGHHNWQSMYFWHALPENWENMEYREFLETRRRLMAKVIRAGFESIGRKYE